MALCTNTREKINLAKFRRERSILRVIIINHRESQLSVFQYVVLKKYAGAPVIIYTLQQCLNSYGFYDSERINAPKVHQNSSSDVIR